MISTIASPKTPSGKTGRLNFQSTLISEVNTTRSSNEGSTTANLGQLNEVFEKNLSQLFTKRFQAIVTGKDAVLKEVRDCILQIDEQRRKDIKLNMHS